MTRTTGGAGAMSKVLIVDDEERVRLAFCESLKYEGNKAKAALLLKIDYTTLRRKMKHYSILPG
ncbi:MAG: hypothetical protein M1510_02000 [Nitrospirae bacterium]|nr:hypothetical protein [Nitrospirota bacterium]